MSKLLDALSAKFETAIVAAFGEAYAGTPAVLRKSSHADFQADVALGLAKKLGRPPREVAQELLDKADLGGLVAKTEIAGPGFVNLTLELGWLSREVAAVAADPRL